MPCDSWSTHMPYLALAIHKFGPRVLEIGCGWYSTPMVHALSDQALGIEDNAEYVSPFIGLCPGKIIYTQKLVAEAFRQSSREWDVVFIDCHKPEDRIVAASFFVNRKVCIVAHDTEQSYWGEVLANVKFRRDFKFLLPHTSFFSNVLDVSA